MKRYYFEMQVRGTASAFVDAKSQEEAVSKMINGEWQAEDNTQETEWYLGTGEIAGHILDVQELNSISDSIEEK